MKTFLNEGIVKNFGDLLSVVRLTYLDTHTPESDDIALFVRPDAVD